jgi:hypothetical protein
MGVNVWAFRVGNYVAWPPAGWMHAIRFSSLGDLTSELESRGLADNVETLAIVAHGDVAGLVQLDRNLTPGTIGSFSSEIAALGRYISSRGKLVFMSCLAGADRDGDQLLTKLSLLLSNRSIIGFTIKGAKASEGMTCAAGQVYEGDGLLDGMPASQLRGLPELREGSLYSKWAWNGSITRLPTLEQAKRPKNKCAKPGCPGHKSPGDRCQLYVKGLSRPLPYAR